MSRTIPTAPSMSLRRPAASLYAGLAAGKAVQALAGASARRSATFRHTFARTATQPICFRHIDRSPGPQDVAAAHTLLLDLLGSTWAARDEGPESRKPGRSRRG
jgi:hypothetical protein